MPRSVTCAQCSAPARRCEECGGAFCARIVCSQLHEATCAGLVRLASETTAPDPPQQADENGLHPRPRPSGKRRAHSERGAAGRISSAVSMQADIDRHRANGRLALLGDELDTAFNELWAARALESDLDKLGSPTDALPNDDEIETNLMPLARALSSRAHPRGALVWRQVLEDGAARSVQGEAAEWLARDAFGRGLTRAGLRILHAANALGRRMDPQALRAAYRDAGIDPAEAFALFLIAVRLDPHSARATGIRDPLTGEIWVDQSHRWWLDESEGAAALLPARTKVSASTDHQLEALARAGDLTVSERERGWLMLAEGDFLSGHAGPRLLARSLRSRVAEPADHDQFMQIRLAFEGAADRLPDVAWPLYRLAELLAWAGFPERALEHMAQADRRKLGDNATERAHRLALVGLVRQALESPSDVRPLGPRPFPPSPEVQRLAWLLRRVPGARKRA